MDILIYTLYVLGAVAYVVVGGFIDESDKNTNIIEVLLWPVVVLAIPGRKLYRRLSLRAQRKRNV